MAAYSLTTGAKLGATIAISLAKEQGRHSRGQLQPHIRRGATTGYLYRLGPSTAQLLQRLTSLNLPPLFSQDNPQDLKYNSNNNLLYVAAWRRRWRRDGGYHGCHL